MQQLFRLLIFLYQPYMFRATNSPILRSTFWLYIQLLVQFTDTAADRSGATGRQHYRCIVPKPVYTVKKCSWEWAYLSPETCRADLKRLINEKLLYLLGCLHHCTNDARSHKHRLVALLSWQQNTCRSNKWTSRSVRHAK